jgi:GGDEF domain-containing protein
MSDNEALQLLLRLPEAERRKAIFDPETGLYAPWYFDLRVHEEIARADRYGELFLLLMVEPARGEFPPEQGEKIASHMRRGLRQTDLVSHLGGFRFVVLLPHAGEAAGSIVAERIRESLGRDLVSVSIACYPGDGNDFASLLGAARAHAVSISGGARNNDGPAQGVA